MPAEERRLNPQLPEDNYITLYMRYGSTLTDAYPEWHFMAAVSQLAVVADRKLVIRLAQGDVYTNVYFVGLGDSTVSRKSTSMRIASTIMTALDLEEKRLPNSFSPEAFIEQMADLQHAYLWLDEAGSMLASMQKTYMNDIRDLFCDLYECRPYRRVLRTSQRRNVRTEFNVTDPYLNQWLMTTPDVFKSNTSLLDATSGWLVRYMFVMPEYEKEWRGFRVRTGDDADLWGQVVNYLRTRILRLQDVREVNMELTQPAWDYYSQWQREQETAALQKKDKIALALLGRAEYHALKLAMLFTFGQGSFDPTHARIDLNMIKEACRLVSDYFIPTAKYVVEELGWDEQSNLLEKILGTLRRSGGRLTRRQLLQKLHRPLKDVKDALESLVESGEIEVSSERPYYVSIASTPADNDNASVGAGSETGGETGGGGNGNIGSISMGRAAELLAEKYNSVVFNPHPSDTESLMNLMSAYLVEDCGVDESIAETVVRDYCRRRGWLR